MQWLITIYCVGDQIENGIAFMYFQMKNATINVFLFTTSATPEHSNLLLKVKETTRGYIRHWPFKYEAQTALFKDPVRTAQ